MIHGSGKFPWQHAVDLPIVLSAAFEIIIKSKNNMTVAFEKGDAIIENFHGTVPLTREVRVGFLYSREA